MLIKSCPVKIKAAGEPDGLAEGEFEAIVSVFGNVDSYGDVVMPGAFTDTLAAWAAKGDPIPVYYSHRMDDPDFNIGEVLEAREIDEGLWVRARIDLDEETPKARQVHRLMKGRRITQFSFAYDIVEAAWVTKGDDEFYELRKLDLYEVGPTPIGANQETELLAVKAAGRAARHLAETIKAGRVLSTKNESTLRESLALLEDASAGIKTVLAAIDDGDPTSDDEKAKDDGPAKDEEPPGLKSEEPNRPSPVDLSALLTIELADAS
jgi:uncharacterized protein